MIDGVSHKIQVGDGLILPAGGGTQHRQHRRQIPEALNELWPPNHFDRLVDYTRADAEGSREVFDGVASE